MRFPREDHKDDSEGGMATVEIALGLFSIMAVLAVVIAVAMAGVTRAATCQAAREGARAESIGLSKAEEVAGSALTRPADVAVSRNGRWVTVSVSAQVPAPFGWVGGTAQCEVRTLLEQAIP